MSLKVVMAIFPQNTILFLDTLYLLTSSDDEGVTPANEAGISMYFENWIKIW